MIDYTTTFHEVPVSEINKDIKDGKWILKSQGNINGDIKAQTVVVYGNVEGNIKADQVVIINGNATGNIKAETVTKLESKEKKNCTSCSFYKKYNIAYDGSWVCPASFPYHRKIDLKICEKYQEKENPAKQVFSPNLPTKKEYY